MTAQNSSFSDLKQRVMSAAGLLIVMVFSLMMGGLFFTTFLGGCTAVLTLELCQVTTQNLRRKNAANIILICLTFLIPVSIHFSYATIYLVAAALIICSVEKTGRWIRLLGVVYISLAVVCVQEIFFSSNSKNGFVELLFIGVVVFSTDIGAYFSGRTFGGPRLWSRISPNKTWSGLLGGIILSIIFGYLYVFIVDKNFVNILIFCLILSSASQIGDLAQSSVKRFYGAKDSGIILPGHGGLFDRFDGLLAAVLTYYFFGHFLGVGIW